MTCPYCNKLIHTDVRYEAGPLLWIVVIILFFFLTIFSCCLLCCDCFKDPYVLRRSLQTS